MVYMNREREREGMMRKENYKQDGRLVYFPQQVNQISPLYKRTNR